jgi:hypothetical protein
MGCAQEQIHLETPTNLIIYKKTFTRRRHLFGENKQRLWSIVIILIIKILQFLLVVAP